MKNGQLILIIGILLTLSIYQNIDAQIKIEKTNSLYLEIGGNNYFYSINYEKLLFNCISPRIGVAILPWGESSHTYGNTTSVKINLLAMINYSLFLSETSVIVIGYGYGSLLIDDYVSSTLSIGFKYIPVNGKMIYKLSFTPLFNNKFVDKSLWAGFGIGFNY